MRRDTRQKIVFDSVRNLYYLSKRSNAQWMWNNHVQFVANKSSELSKRFKAKTEFVVVAALLHDLGDIWLDRTDLTFEKRTEKEAKCILKKASYEESEIFEIFEKIITPHSCYPNNMPATIEGKILATADALAHLTTDFYSQFQKMGIPKRLSPKKFYSWARKKIDRDYNSKIFFEEIKKNVTGRYQSLLSSFKETQI